MLKIMVTQSILWATAILLSVINSEASWWLIGFLAVMAIGMLRAEINKITN
jgi:hypothetical protein